MKNLLAIDPGASGGLAWINDGSVIAVPMPEGMTAQADLIRTIAVSHHGIAVVMERVGTYMPGNSGPAAATFARHCGHLDAICYMAGLAVTLVSPQTWMKHLGQCVSMYLPANYKTLSGKAKKAARAKAVRDNKHAIQELMARRYPNLTVTLKTADALGILTWAMQEGGGQ